MQVDIVYRCCEGDTKKEFRPKYFDKRFLFCNFMEVFRCNRIKGVKVRFHIVHDGPTGELFTQIEYFQNADYDKLWHSLDESIFFNKINVNSNEKSLELCLELAAGLPKTDIIYFIEDDYLHTLDALEVLVDGFKTAEKFNKSNIISLYDHPDRYVRTDDIDRGQTHILLGEKRYWRTAESTTCTWATTQSSFLNEGLYEAAMALKLNDRELFRGLRRNGTILFTPMMAASTHCHTPFMSPFVDWKDVL